MNLNLTSKRGSEMRAKMISQRPQWEGKEIGGLFRNHRWPSMLSFL